MHHCNENAALMFCRLSLYSRRISQIIHVYAVEVNSKYSIFTRCTANFRRLRLFHLGHAQWWS